MVEYPKDWVEIPITELGHFTSGDGFPLHYQGNTSAKYPFYKVSDFNNLGNERTMRLANNYISEEISQKLCCHIIPSGAIVFAKIGAAIYLERKRITEYDCCIDNNMMAFSVNDDVDVHYICYIFQKMRFGDYVSVTALPSLNPKIIGNIKITIPQDVAEQRAIAATLSTFDTHIDNLTALIEKKKAIRDGALADLMSGRTRLEGFSGEWEEKKIGDILKILHGKNQHSVECLNGKYPILGTGGVIGRANTFLCDWECVLIGRKGTIDNPMHMNKPFWTIDTLYYSRPFEGQCVKFQYYLFCTIDWKSYAESSGRPSLTRKGIENIDVHIPKFDEQKAIADILTSMDTEIQNLEAERDKFIQIREGAMDDLLTGRVRLPM